MITDKLINNIHLYKNPVLLTGAGISTLSGVPDYSNLKGFINSKGIQLSARESLKESNCYFRERDNFIDWFIKNFSELKYKDNKIYDFIDKLYEKNNNLKVITQNIDGLHLNRKYDVIEFHGNKNNWYCDSCYKIFNYKDALNNKFYCDEDYGYLLPDIVLYDQNIDESIAKKSKKIVENADLVIIMGTSLEVYPFAYLVMKNLYINKDADIIYIDKSPNYENLKNLNSNMEIVKFDFNEL